MSTAGSTREILDLAATACDGGLGDVQVARLDLLLNDPELRQVYVQFMWMDGLLELAEADVAPRWHEAPQRRVARRRRISWAAVALLVAVSLAAAWFFRPSVARIVALAPDSVVTDAAGRIVGVGSTFQSGRVLHIPSGLAELELTQGTRVRVSGPAAIQIKSGNACRLLHGAVVADVPPPAIGFRVYARQGIIEDFGTTFCVQSLAEISAVSVLSGHVELASPAGRVPLGSLSVARMSDSRADIVEERFEIERFSVAPSLVPGVDEVAGDILVFDLAPPRIAPGLIENDEHALLFVEQQGVTRDPAWQLDLVPEQSGAAGRGSVDSFLLHFDPTPAARVESTYARSQGSIRFHRPIVGVVLNPDTLVATDLACARSKIEFPAATHLRRSAFWEAERENDLVAIEPDGHTLRFDLLADGNTLSGLDQLRVFVAADPAKRPAEPNPR